MATQVELLAKKAELEREITTLKDQNIYLELTPEQIAAYITQFHHNKEMQRENDLSIAVAREELHEVLEELRTDHNYPG